MKLVRYAQLYGVTSLMLGLEINTLVMLGLEINTLVMLGLEINTLVIPAQNLTECFPRLHKRITSF